MGEFLYNLDMDKKEALKEVLKDLPGLILVLFIINLLVGIFYSDGIAYVFLISLGIAVMISKNTYEHKLRRGKKAKKDKNL